MLPEYLGDLADGGVIVAHLGSGASLCAMRQRQSVATTMGFTALDGRYFVWKVPSIDLDQYLEPNLRLGVAQK